MSEVPSSNSQLTPETRRALIVEDWDDDAELVVRALRKAGMQLQHRRVDTEVQFVQELSSGGWDVILCDYDVPGFGAPRALELLEKHRSDVPLIVISGRVDEEQAVNVLRSGAKDFVTKSRLTRLAPAVFRAISETEQRRKTRRELEEAREALIRSEKLRTLGFMAVGVAHDLRNILNPLSLQVQLLQRGEFTFERQKTIADNLSRTLKRGTELIQRLQAFGRQGPEAVQSCDLRAEVAQACELLKTNVRQHKGLSLETRIEDVGLVRAVPSEVVSATVNLVTNAIEALGAGPGRLFLATAATEDSAMLTVHDDGPGMPPEVKARLFEPFFTTKAHGTGLGLAGIYAFVQRCEGKIAVESELGKGTKITLTFQRVGNSASPGAGEPDEPRS